MKCCVCRKEMEDYDAGPDSWDDDISYISYWCSKCNIGYHGWFDVWYIGEYNDNPDEDNRFKTESNLIKVMAQKNPCENCDGNGSYYDNTRVRCVCCDGTGIKDFKWPEETCEWNIKISGVPGHTSKFFETKCQKSMHFESKNSDFKYCPYCGKHIEIILR